jgi:hypothetical protein
MFATLVAMVSIGIVTTGQAAAVVSNITVYVMSDTTPQHHQEGVAYDGTNGNAQIPVATFFDSDACPTPSTCQTNGDYTATVQWSGVPSDTSSCPAVDCTISAPTFVSGTTASYDIAASHTFRDEFNCQPTPCANDPITVTVNDTADAMTGKSDNVTGTNSCGPGTTSPCLGIAIKDQPLTASPLTFNPTSGVSFSGQIGGFQDANPLAMLTDVSGSSEYSVAIDWGDGTAVDHASDLAIGTCDVTGCQVSISGTHTYTNSNIYPVAITVQDGLDFQFKIQVNSTANVQTDGGARCTSADVVPSSSSAPAGSVPVLTAGAGGCSTPHYEFWVQYPGGIWHMIQPWGGSTFNWNTALLVQGVYHVHVWANQTTSTTYEAFGSATVTLTGCATASLLPTTQDLPPGTSVAFTASSTGCNAPVHYKYWLGYPNGTWQMLRDWGPSAFNWTVNPAAKGHFKVHVWANTINGSLTKYQAFAESTVNLVVCSSASFTTPTSPVTQTAGSTVHFVAIGGGCLSPQFEYWIGYSNGTWQLLRGWGSGTFDWITNPAAVGTYTIHVWANNTGDSKTTYEAFASTTVTLTP